jgi:hypothetical protein
MHRIFPAAIVAGALAVLAALAAPNFGSAQAPPVVKSEALPTYRPGLGDLMTMTVQPRHIKLALAGREKNWPYAAYELHQLEEAFDRVVRYWPQWRRNPIADLMDSVTKEPMAKLSQAIKSADGDGYNAAYKQLTDACNTCHLGANVGVNLIVVPGASTFPDQDFRPLKP